ncbi:hypothetical protein QZH41_011755 [Actinostola sp. cb2023]|nr:hypothetical protein QZH41_011755 [Actinostola sp. cb2023]
MSTSTSRASDGQSRGVLAPQERQDLIRDVVQAVLAATSSSPVVSPLVTSGPSALLAPASLTSSLATTQRSASTGMWSVLSAPSFANTFAASTSRPGASSMVSSSLANGSVTSWPSLVAPSLAAVVPPVLHQPFVIGPGCSPIPSKLVTQIVGGKFVDLSELIAANLTETQNEPQLLLDGRVVLSTTPRRQRRRIDDIVTWLEAFSIFKLVLASYFPQRWADLSRYQLLILRTHRQFNGRAWLTYDKAFREHVAATNTTDWSTLNPQLYSFHTAGSAPRGPSNEATEAEGSNENLHGLPPVSAVSPLQVARFAHELAGHPDKARVEFVLNGLCLGFRIGFHKHQKLRSATKNKESASSNPQVIDSYIDNEVRLGRVAGPFATPPLPHLQVSSFGVIPKRGQPGKWRLIVDLSSPRGLSVNDGIDRDEFTLQYIRVDQIIQMVSDLGRGALMAKFDVESAYRNVAVHPSDRYLLGMKWKGNYFVDLALPFGLRSAPFIFNSVATMVEWILSNNYCVSNLVHYLDDFILAGPPNSDRCARNLNRSLQVCHELGLPLHPAKCVGPVTTMVVLGIELDSIHKIARLPADKLSDLQKLIQSWRPKRTCNKRQLESLIGHLHHAAKVVWPGRTFVRRMIDLLCCFRKPDHPIRLNCEFRRDLNWWHQFLSLWHGVSFWLYPGVPVVSEIEVVSDASGSIGYGAFYNQQWFNGVWINSQSPNLLLIRN